MSHQQTIKLYQALESSLSSSASTSSAWRDSLMQNLHHYYLLALHLFVHGLCNDAQIRDNFGWQFESVLFAVLETDLTLEPQTYLSAILDSCRYDDFRYSISQQLDDQWIYFQDPNNTLRNWLANLESTSKNATESHFG